MADTDIDAVRKQKKAEYAKQYRLKRKLLLLQQASKDIYMIRYFHPWRWKVYVSFFFTAGHSDKNDSERCCKTQCQCTEISNCIYYIRRSQWPRGLRRRSAAARLLRSWFESHRGRGCLSVVSSVCCQIEVSATSWSLIQRSPTDRGKSLFVVYKTSRWDSHAPRWLAAPQQKKKLFIFVFVFILDLSILSKDSTNF
jgi:hypothetical protein